MRQFITGAPLDLYSWQTGGLQQAGEAGEDEVDQTGALRQGCAQAWGCLRRGKGDVGIAVLAVEECVQAVEREKRCHRGTVGRRLR